MSAHALLIADPFSRTLERFPAETPTEGQELAAEVLEHFPAVPKKSFWARFKLIRKSPSDEEVFQLHVNVLLDKLESDEFRVKAQYAVSGIAKYANEPDRETERELTEEILLVGLEQDYANETKAFLFEQLELVGSDRSLETIEGFLDDEKLALPAVEAAIAVATKKAANTLAEPLDEADVHRRVHLLIALGVLGHDNVVDEVGEYVQADDAEVSRAAVDALVAIGSPKCRRHLEEALGAPGSSNDAQFAQRYVDYAGNLDANGYDRDARRTLEPIVANGGHLPGHVWNAALVTWAGVEAEFVSLFNGVNLEGWTGDKQGYGARNGKLVCMPGGKLWTQKDFDDFELRFEFRLTPGANNGLGIRMAPGAHAAYDAMELQILDNTAEKYNDLQPYQYHGSIYGIVPAERGHLRPIGEWNYQEVIADGYHIIVRLNGATIVDANIKEASKGGTMDGKDHPGLLRESGRIGFLGHGDFIEFRNIRIKEL